MKGKIKSFNDEKEYGFIIPDSGGHDLFFHMRDVWGDCDFCDGDPVEFNIIDTPRGRRAINIIKAIGEREC